MNIYELQERFASKTSIQKIELSKKWLVMKSTLKGLLLIYQ
jgi:hypothetical protein